jgi:hypothetical protein
MTPLNICIKKIKAFAVSNECPQQNSKNNHFLEQNIREVKGIKLFNLMKS